MIYLSWMRRNYAILKAGSFLPVEEAWGYNLWELIWLNEDLLVPNHRIKKKTIRY